MNTRPPTTVGCALFVIPCGTPKAHLSFRRGTSLAVRRAAAAGWKRVFARSGLQPFHPGPLAGSRIGGLAVHWFGVVDAAERAAAHELGDTLLLDVAERLPFRVCRRLEAGDDPLGRHLPDRIRRRLGVGRHVSMTAETLLLERGPAALGTGSPAASRGRGRRGALCRRS